MLNDLFVQAVYYANGVLFMLMVYLGMTSVFKPKVKRKWILFAYIVFIFASAELFLAFENMWINLAINTIALVSFSFFFEGRLSARIVFSVLIYAMSIMADGLSFLVINHIHYLRHGTEIQIEYIQTVVRTFTNIIFLPFFLLAILLFRKSNADKLFQKHIRIPKTYTVSALVIIAGVVLANVLFISASSGDFHTTVIPLSISLFISAIIIMLIIWLYNAILNHLEMLEEGRVREQMLERWENQYKAACESQKIISDMNHNLRYHFLTLDTYLKKGEVTEAAEHINEYIGKLGNGINTRNISIDAMLNYYQQRIKENLGIELKTELMIPSSMKLNPTHIVTILGNALENAMEACELVEHSSRYINVKASITTREALLVVIVNPYSVTPITDKNGDLMTTKKDKHNHGLGLASIREIMPDEKGYTYFEYADNVFKFMAVFYDVK